MNIGPAEFFLLTVLFGTVTGAVAYSRRPTVRTFVGFFVLGAVFPVVGLLVALVVKRRPPARPAAV